MSIPGDSPSPLGVGTSNQLRSDQAGSNQPGSVDALGIRWEGPIVEGSVRPFVRQRGPEIVYVFVENPKTKV
jgi:hypothetical protein